MKRLFLVAAWSLLLAAAPSKSQPVRPLPIGTVHFGSSALRQMLGGDPLGTAFLVGPCDIVSAKHVAPRGRPIVGARLRFNAPGHSTGGTVIAAGDDPRPWAPGTTRGGDWIVARLDRCLGNDLGWFRLSASRFTETPQFTGRGAALEVAGYPAVRDRAKGIVVARGCGVTSVLADGTIAAACHTESGQSGGPVFIVVEYRGERTLVALGIISAGVPGQPALFAAPVDEIAALFPEALGTAATADALRLAGSASVPKSPD